MPCYVLRGFLYLRWKCRDMSSEGNAAHPVGYNSPLHIKMASLVHFLKFELTGLGVGARYRL